MLVEFAIFEKKSKLKSPCCCKNSKTAKKKKKKKKKMQRKKSIRVYLAVWQ